MSFERYMEGRYDKGWIYKQAEQDRIQAHKISDEIEKQKIKARGQLVDDTLEEDISEEDEAAIQKIYDDYASNKEEYLVDGAYLTCNMAVFEEREILGVRCGCRINESIKNRKGTVLHVFGNTEIINGGLAATVKDHTLNRNIAPLKCNCRNLPDRISEKQKLFKNINLCRQYGTCQVLMRLDRDWENIIRSSHYEEYNYTDNEKEITGAKAITMKSMLFCSHGGIITPVTSGQTAEIVFSKPEEKLYEKFYDNITYENWTDGKKRCAEEIWKKFYVECGYDAAFVAGLIGNVYEEGEFGMLQEYGCEWAQFNDENNTYEGYMVISNMEQARVACLVAPDGYGIGAVQWSSPGRKKTLYSNYVKQSKDGTLSMEQLIKAELQTLSDEFAEGYYHKVCTVIYDNYVTGTTSDDITLATCIIFKNYEAPSTREKVDSQNKYTLADGVMDSAENAQTFNELPSIIKRILAAKAAYEALK